MLLVGAGCFASSSLASALPPQHSPCQIRSITFGGWKAEELLNDWVRLTVVPQLGGRLMQVEFGQHCYLFAVFWAGKLNAHVFDMHGMESDIVELEPVDPLKAVELNQVIRVSPGASRVAIHLSDERGIDRDILDDADSTTFRKDS